MTQLSKAHDVPTAHPARTNTTTTPATAPRLLNLRTAAAYVGVSYWTIRDWVLAGFIPTVDLPPLRPREGERARAGLRRVLIDRADLDAFIEARKQRGHDVFR